MVRAGGLWAVVLLLAAGGVLAADGGVVAPENPVPTSNAGGATEPAAKAPELGADPVFDVVRRLYATDDDGAAAVVELGDTPEFVRKGDGGWTFSKEEAAPPGHTRGNERPVQPGDPEWVRVVDHGDDADDAPPAAKPATKRPATIKASDPERFSRGHTELPEVAEEERPTRPAARVSTAPPSVRYSAGDGVDSEAAELVAEMVMTERAAQDKPAPQTLLEKKAASDAEKVAAAGADEPPAEAVALAPDAHADAKNKIRELLTSEKKPGSKHKGRNKEADDPEAAYNEVIQQIEEKNKLLAAKLAEARENEAAKPAAPDEKPLWVRDPRAARAIEALRQDKPLGSVAIRIIDVATKTLVPARVKVVDSTDVPAESPLPVGTWCAGTHSVPVVSGAVKIEITRGRFHPIYVKGVDAKPSVATPYDALMGRPAVMNFPARGWYLADLDMGLRVRRGERALWFGGNPTLADLALAARAEGVHVLGVPLPWGTANEGEQETLETLQAAQGDDLLLLPVFPGPKNAFHGSAFGLGMTSWDALSHELVQPEQPLFEAFNDIRERGGLAVYTKLAGTRLADVKKDILPLFPRLEKAGYYGSTATTARLYAAHELPFDTVIGPAYDAFAFDGSEMAQQLWFNLLNHGYDVAIIGAGGGSLEGGRVPFGQTFLKTDGPPTRENVLDAIKKGRTVVSFGPAAFATILERDMGPGSVLPADGRRLTLQIQAYATMNQSAQIEKVEVIRNGVVVQTHLTSEGEAQVPDFRLPLSETMTSWYIVRVTERSGVNVNDHKRTQAWTSPIYFRGPAYSAPAPVQSRVTGVLRIGPNATAGTVTGVIPGQPPQEVAIDATGKFKIDLPASATLIFSAPGCEPAALRVFEHPRVQKALCSLQTERTATLPQHFAKPSLFAAWNLLLSELEWDVTLVPLGGK